MEDSLRLPNIKPDHVIVRERLPCVLLVMPIGMPAEVIGIVSEVQSPSQEIWQLIAASDAAPMTIAKLLGILILHRHENIMPPAMMPSKSSVAWLLSSGEIRQGRGKNLAPWAITEIDRLAILLFGDHRAYISGVQDALQGGTKTFSTLPEDFIIQDESGFCRLGPAPPLLEVKVDGSERVRYGFDRSQVGALDYQRNRFMAHLRTDQLERRIEDIIANSYVINSQGLIGPEVTPFSLYWFEKLQEVITEMELRHGPYPAGWRSGFVDRSRLPGSLQEKQLDRRKQIKPLNPLPETFLVKYGKIEHIEAAYSNGQIRISPASGYTDPSLNAAIKDDELVAELDFDPTFSGVFEDLGDRISVENPRQEVQGKLNTNFYVYCTSSQLSTRLLLDFEAEAALVIREVNEFLRRINIAVSQQLSNWRPRVMKVTYYDPLQTSPREVSVIASKHFRYAYQNEVRLVWLPPKPIQTLEPIIIELGPLSDIAELLRPVPVDENR